MKDFVHEDPELLVHSASQQAGLRDFETFSRVVIP